MRDTLEDLLDKRELDELMYKTMHAMDGRDWPAYRRNCLADAAFDFTDHGAAGDETAAVMVGADLFLADLSTVCEGFDATQHAITNMVHTLAGDSARTNCYVHAEHFLENDRGDRSVTCAGRYEIESRRTPEGWRIARLRFVTSWFRGNTALYGLARKRSTARIKRSSS